MGVIAPLLAVLVRAGLTRVAVSPDAYFELAWITERFFPELTLTSCSDAFSSDAEVLWLDTISSAWPSLPAERGSTQLVVVDTTCVEPTSDHVARWLEAGERLDVPLVLVRSHVKLDCFGLELSRLGSAIVVAPGDDDARITTLAQHLREAVSLFGTTFTIASLYPWLGDPEFARLTRARTEGIRDSTARLAAALADSPTGYAVLPRAHGLAVLLRLARHGESVDTPLGTSSTPPSSLARRIADSCVERGLPAVAAGSFGLDQIAVTDFTDLRDGRHYIRLCGADVGGTFEGGPEKMIADVVRAIITEHEAAG
jgi:hypothetical protein